jgi:D-glycero-alpha-D-manno-heptose-7-phosphate kinase
MIISRAPFRVSFCGGGSDIPSFYEKYGGCVISSAIAKYVYVTINPTFDKNTIALKYSKTEIVKDPKDIEHQIFRVVLTDFGTKGIEISSMADIPSGTGLGSSSSFTVALLRALYTYTDQVVSTYKVAKEACDVEIRKLGHSIGKQDQFAASFGGLRYYEFCPDGFVKVEPIVMKHESYAKLEESLMMFYTGDVRDANQILATESKSLASDSQKIEGTKKLCDLTKELKESFENNNIDSLGPVLQKSWEIKKSLANGISNLRIDEYYDKAIKAGAKGGKLLGAGGGGFLLFYVPDAVLQKRVRVALSDLKELKYQFDFYGCSIIFMD